MIAGATPIRTSVSANVTDGIHDDEVARRHQTDPAGAHGSLDGGDRRAVGLHQALHHLHHRAASRGAPEPADRSFRSAPAQNAGPSWRSTIARTRRSSASVIAAPSSATSCMRQGVPVVLGVERDGGDPSAMSRRTSSAMSATVVGPIRRRRRGANAGRSRPRPDPRPLHRRQRLDDVPPVSRRPEPGVEHGDHSTVGRVADQATGRLGQQGRRTRDVDLAERGRAELLAASREQRVVRPGERQLVDDDQREGADRARRRPGTDRSWRTGRSPPTRRTSAPVPASAGRAGSGSARRPRRARPRRPHPSPPSS